MNPTDQQDSQPSQLFTIRIWSEPLGDGQSEWRGQVRHILSGETRYFRAWPQLVAYLQHKTGAPGGEAAD